MTITNEEDKNLSVSTKYITPDFDYKIYQQKLEANLNHTEWTRNKTVAAAIFLATEFPKLPYFWGGGHECSVEELNGINKKWGSIQQIIYKGADYYAFGENFPYAYDCSGFVSWCLINGGYNITSCLNTTGLGQLGPKKSLMDSKILEEVQIGDLGTMVGHVGIIVDINKETKEISFAHISHSGWGMNITTISTETGLITKDDLGVLPTVDKNRDPIQIIDRVGTSFCDEILFIPYKF